MSRASASLVVASTPVLGIRTKLGRYDPSEHWLEVSRLICSQDELFLSHVFGGITWVLDSGTTVASNANADLGRPPATATDCSPPPAAPP